MSAPEQCTMTVKQFAEEMKWDPSTVRRAIKTDRVKTISQRSAGLQRVKAYAIPCSEVERINKEEEERLRRDAGAGGV